MALLIPVYNRVSSLQDPKTLIKIKIINAYNAVTPGIHMLMSDQTVPLALQGPACSSYRRTGRGKAKR